MGFYLEGHDGLAKNDILSQHGILVSKEDVLACKDFNGDLYVCAMHGGWLAAAIIWNENEARNLINGLDLKVVFPNGYIDCDSRFVDFWLVERKWVNPSLPEMLRR